MTQSRPFYLVKHVCVHTHTHTIKYQAKCHLSENFFKNIYFLTAANRAVEMSPRAELGDFQARLFQRFPFADGLFPSAPARDIL